MARLLAYFNQDESREINVLVATSGDTGSAVANGFLGVEGVRVFVLYPKGRVSPIQECQFTTLGQNITALEIDGSFDDCQALVKSAFMDPDLTARMKLTSANSINVARFLPQSFYYFHGVGQMQQKGRGEDLVICVPSGNFGNLCSALFAVRMGLPVKRMIAANNRNDVFFKYLQTGQYIPRPSIATLANAMDVGDPSNFARILDLYDGDWNAIRAFLSGQSVDDDTILSTIRDCRWQTGYILDPHGACAYRALADGLRDGENGLFCETAHPAKFKDTVEEATDQPVGIPGRLAAFMRGEKKSVPLPADFQAFKAYLSSI
jgi:threonine synthase